MTRLPWQHTQSRAKSGSDKSHLSNPQEWFSRTTSEPSRQALSDLVRAHKRETSDDSKSSRSRSRSTTVTSPDWQKARSRRGSASEDHRTTFELPPTREGSIYSTYELKEGSPKSFLAKGSLMLKRTGSKLSLSSTGSSSTLGLNSPPRPSTTNSNICSRDDIRGRISIPFDFQHVTHTEQVQFAGLSRIEEAELAQRFDTIATEQLPVTELRGIEASDIHSMNGLVKAMINIQCATPVEAAVPLLPATPPRPNPPPKDMNTKKLSLRVLQSPIRSRPSSPVSPRRSHPRVVDPSSDVNDMAALRPSCKVPKDSHTIMQPNLNSKPLPQLPIIHAVTTMDDSARAMIAVPLPTPPSAVSPAFDYFSGKGTPHHRQKSSIATSRQLTTYPSSKVSMPDLLAPNHRDSAIRALPRHRSDMALSRQNRDVFPSRESCVSTNFSVINTMNWEDAIDEAWDVSGADGDDDPTSPGIRTPLSSNASPSLAGPLRPNSHEAAMVSPMITESKQVQHLPAGSVSPFCTQDFRKLECVQEDQPQSCKNGLGISACLRAGPNSPTINFSRSSSLHLRQRSSSTSCVPQESLTRSSSQESIILSIASSVVGTQRSSSSSVLAEDLMHMNRVREHTINETPEEENDRDKLYPDLATKPRPESGCLPSGVLDYVMQSSIDNAAIVFPIPPVPNHKHGKSSSKLVVPERRSSIVASELGTSTRKRSNTTGTRPRQGSRMSYSLFPCPQGVAS